jgi:hypothetical protein
MKNAKAATPFQFSEYVKTINIVRTNKPAHKVTDSCNITTNNKHEYNHNQYRTQLNSAASRSRHRTKLRSAAPMLSLTKEVHLPSFNEIRSTMKRDIVRKHQHELDTLQIKLNTLSKTDVD